MDPPGEEVSGSEAGRQLLVARLLPQADVGAVDAEGRVGDAEPGEEGVCRLAHLALRRHVDQRRRLVHDGDGDSPGGLAGAALLHTWEWLRKCFKPK